MTAPLTTICGVSDVTIGATTATLCQYFPPHQNDSESLLNSAAFAGIGSWDLQWKTDNGDQNADGALQLSLTGLNLLTGEGALDWNGGAATADVAVVVKAASEFHAYFFDDLVFDAASGSFDVSWLVQIFNDQGVRQGLSHLSLYSSGPQALAPPSGCGGGDPACGPGVPTLLGTPPQESQVPAPAPIALIGIGLLGLLGAASRRARVASPRT